MPLRPRRLRLTAFWERLAALHIFHAIKKGKLHILHTIKKTRKILAIVMKVGAISLATPPKKHFTKPRVLAGILIKFKIMPIASIVKLLCVNKLASEVYIISVLCTSLCGGPR